MFFKIEPANGIAIYDQVVRQIKFSIANGVVQKGELIPSVRDLAKQLTINPNTVSRAYRQLQDDQVLEPVRGMGLQVAEGAKRKCRTERLQIVRRRLRDALSEALASGLEGDEVKQIVEKEIRKLED